MSTSLISGGGVEDLASTVVLPIVNNDVCARIYASEFDFTGRLCAGYNLQSKGICKVRPSAQPVYSAQAAHSAQSTHALYSSC